MTSLNCDRALRVAMVGCGGHARSDHGAPLAAYQKSHGGEIDLVACCDLDLGRAQQVCRDFGFRQAFTDADAMIRATKPQALVCVMPVARIAPVAQTLFPLGIPLMVEKPLGANLEEARQLARIAAETQTPHMVSVNRRFIPHLVRGLAWAKSQGPLRHVRVCQYRAGRLEDEFLWATGIHPLDALRFLAGDSAGETLTFPPQLGQGVPWVEGHLKMAGGVTATVSLFPTAGRVEETYEIFGDGFSVCVTLMADQQTRLEAWKNGDRAIREETPAGSAPMESNGTLDETTHFIRSIRTGRPLGPTVTEVLPSLEMVLRWHRAAFKAKHEPSSRPGEPGFLEGAHQPTRTQI